MTSENAGSFNNLINQCRFCLRSFDESQKQIRIDRNIKSKFYSLTRIELISSKFYSKNICSLCNNLLDFFNHYRDDFTKKQRMLDLQLGGSRKLKPKRRKKFSEPPDESSSSAAVHEDLISEFIVKVEPVEVKEEEEDPVIQSVFAAPLKTELEVDECKPFPSFLYDSAQDDKSDDSWETEPPPRARRKREPKEKSKKYKKINCPEKDCSKFFLDQQKLADHVKFVHLAIPFQCTICNFKTHTRDLLKSHDLRMHGDYVNNKEKEQCPECGVFVTGLSAHVKQVHTKDHPLKCDLCSFGTFAKYLIKRHMLSAHFPKDLKKRVSCPICGKKLIVSSGNVSLKAHLKNVHGSQGKKFQCYCGLFYKSELYLKNHQRIVHERKGKKHHCPTCDKCEFIKFLRTS